MARKKEKELTPEQELEQARVSELRQVEEWIRYMNEPTYRFNVGDKVLYGALKESVVEQVLYDGKAYLLRCIATNNNYGNPYDYVCYHAAKWVDVRPQTPDAETNLTSKNGIDLHFMNKSIESLLHQYYSFGVDMNPDYQRDFVWDAADKEYLLDSIFKGIDIGKFVFVSRPLEKWREDRVSYEILDGKQRLNTLVEFYEDRITYKGYTYSQLGRMDRRTFREHMTSVAEVRDADEKDILLAFLSLNRGGRVMDKAQLERVEQMLADTNNG